MGYKDSDVLLFFFILAILIYIFGKKNRPDPPAGKIASPPQVRQEQAIPMEQRELPAGEPLQFADAGSVKGLFLIITTPYAQTQIMALSLSTQVKGKGKSVRILLCDGGGELALKGSKEVILKPLDKSPQMMLKGLIAQGVIVEVCPFFLANKPPGSPADLIEGVAIAKPPVIADALLEPGVKLFTF